MLFLLLLILGQAPTPVVNPGTAEFTASADHNVVDVSGVPILTKYELRIFLADGDTFVKPVNLNKPVPGTNNLISLGIKDTILALPSGSYTSRVASIGPGGETVSEKSNVFYVDKGLPVTPSSVIIKKE
jgi:hypothetical protein